MCGRTPLRAPSRPPGLLGRCCGSSVFHGSRLGLCICTRKFLEARTETRLPSYIISQSPQLLLRSPVTFEVDRYLTSAWRLLRALWATSFRKFCFLLFLPCPAPGLSSEWCSCTGAPAEVYVLRKRAS
nr:bisphosphoglycerate mutase isoform X2 [Columba livia]